MPNDNRPSRTSIAIALVLGVGCAPQPAAYQLTVTTTDYAFQMLDTVRAGPIVFHLRNAGAVRHELLLSELKAGVRPESAYAVVQKGGDIDAVFEKDAALLVAGPGETPQMGLRANLTKGRTYVLACTLQDAPDKPPHVMLGMYKPFVAK